MTRTSQVAAQFVMRDSLVLACLSACTYVMRGDSCPYGTVLMCVAAEVKAAAPASKDVKKIYGRKPAGM